MSKTHSLTDTEILKYLAQRESPDARPPTPEELAKWIEQGDCPQGVLEEAGRLYNQTTGSKDGVRFVLDALPWGAEVEGAPKFYYARFSLFWIGQEASSIAEQPTSFSYCYLTDLLDIWKSIPKKDQPSFPLQPVVATWLNRPPEVEPETRKGRRILTVVHPQPRSHEEADLPLLKGLTAGRTSQEFQLPLWSPPRLAYSVPLLNAIDALQGVPIMSQGRGASLEARLFVYSALSVQMKDRRLPTVRLPLRVEELRDMFWPNGWQKGRDWPRLRAALMKVRDIAIHDDDSYWFLLHLVRLPADLGDGPDLKDLVLLDVAIPPGAYDGPSVDLPELFQMGVTSSPRWRAYIAGRSLLWVPGKTRRPVPKSRKRRHGWSKNDSDYPILTAADRLSLAFGPQDSKHRTLQEIDAAWRGLPSIVIDEGARNPNTYEKGWRILPAEQFSTGE